MKHLRKKIINNNQRCFWSNEREAKYLRVKIGSNCEVFEYSWGSEPYLIEVGNHVQITDGVNFFTHGGSWVFRAENSRL